MNEPIIIPADYDNLTAWFNIIRHANRVIVRGANQWVQIGVFVDKNGIPQFWEVHEPRDLSPKSKEVIIRD